MPVYLHYRLEGDPEKPLLILLHGFLGSHRDWSPIIENLRHSYRLLAIDLPGHGYTRVTGGADGYTFLAAATAMIEIADSLDAATFSVIGYSMGGRLALYLASIYAMRIDSLVIESASPGLRSEEERAARRAQDEEWARMLDRGDMRAFLDRWYAQPLFASLHRDEARFQALLDERLKNCPAELARALRGMGAGSQQPLWGEWSDNHIPALLIVGESDAKYRAIADEMASLCREAVVEQIPGSGHNVHYERPDSYTTALTRFLEGKGVSYGRD